jgi:hypothetical protein
LDSVHCGGESALWASHKQVVVGAHQTVGMEFDLTPSNCTSQASHEDTVVHTALEERPPRDGTVEYVVPGAWLIVTRDSGHWARIDSVP